MNGTGRNGPLIQERAVGQGEVFSAVLGLLALARQIDSRYRQRDRVKYLE